MNIQFCGHGKISAWNIFSNHPELLAPVGTDGEMDLENAEQFVIIMYTPTATAISVNALRSEMFLRVGEPEKLPPTQDALQQHLLRCQYKVMIWCQTTTAKPHIPPVENFGWKKDTDSILHPILMQLDPAPKGCTELLKCGCMKSKCISGRCM
jgi:hypothetical protein